MPFKDSQEAENRLRGNPDRITPQEWRDLMPWIHDVSGLSIKRVDAELALQNIEAVQKFEQSSSMLTWWLIGMTGALVVMTAALVYYTYVLAKLAH
jgi:hypothetical protein